MILDFISLSVINIFNANPQYAVQKNYNVHATRRGGK